MSCRMRGRRVTMPVPRGRLYQISRVVCGWLVLLGPLTSPDRRCFPAPNSSHWIVSQRLQSVVDLWDFAPMATMVRLLLVCAILKTTYADGCEDILQLVDQCDKAWIINVDPDFSVSTVFHRNVRQRHTRALRWSPCQAVGTKGALRQTDDLRSYWRNDGFLARLTLEIWFSAAGVEREVWTIIVRAWGFCQHKARETPNF